MKNSLAKGASVNNTNAIKGRLFNISPATCLKVYPKVFQNADQTFKAAMLLRENGFYGAAITFVTASMEEYLKGIILQLDCLGFDFRNTKGVSRFFTEHTIRHVMAGILLCVYTVGKDVVDMIKDLFSDPFKFAAFAILASNLEQVSEDLQQYIRIKAKEMKSDLPFFLQIEDMRQLGFYSDYPDNFHAPDMITNIMCTNTFDKFEKIRWLIIEFSQAMAQKDQKEQIKQMISIMKENQFYLKLADQLSGVRSEELFERFNRFLDRTEKFSF